MPINSLRKTAGCYEPITYKRREEGNGSECEEGSMGRNQAWEDERAGTKDRNRAVTGCPKLLDRVSLHTAWTAERTGLTDSTSVVKETIGAPLSLPKSFCKRR